MRGSYAALLAFAVAAGMALPFQAAVNARLRVAVGGPVRASLLSFAVGSALLAVVSLAVRESWPGLHDAARGPAWMWLGGLLGACYLFSTIVLVPRLGPAVTFVLVVAGQMAASLTLEQFGLLGVARHPISLPRIAGALLLVCAVALLRR